METTNRRLYRALHPGMSFDNRRRCLQDLAELGYQVGSGNLVGLPGQTVEILAGDVVFFKQGDFDMISVGPLIPHPQTNLADAPTGDLKMTLKVMALARIVSRNAHIPANTAIGSLHGRDERPKALAAGANVIMPNFTPKPVKSLYDIYPGKLGRDLSARQSVASVERMVAAAGRWIDRSRGDSLKAPSHAGSAPASGN
jgi:biotin synthase